MRKTTTKQDLSELVAASIGIDKKTAIKAIDALTVVIAESVEAGHTVTLRGFGTFRPAHRKAKTARNLATMAPIEVPARTVPVFTPSAEFCQRVAVAAVIPEADTQF